MAQSWSPDTSDALVVGHWKSANNLSGYEGRAVKISAGAIVLATATTSGCLVLANGGNASAVNVGVVIGGITEVQLADTVSALQWLQPNSASLFSGATITSAYNYSVMALMSGVSGDIIRAAVNLPRRF